MKEGQDDPHFFILHPHQHAGGMTGRKEEVKQRNKQRRKEKKRKDRVGFQKTNPPPYL